MSDLNFASFPSAPEPFIIQDVMDAWKSHGQVKFDEFGRMYPDIDWDGTDTDDLRASLDEQHSPFWALAIMLELDDRYDGW